MEKIFMEAPDGYTQGFATTDDMHEVGTFAVQDYLKFCKEAKQEPSIEDFAETVAMSGVVDTRKFNAPVDVLIRSAVIVGYAFAIWEAVRDVSNKRQEAVVCGEDDDGHG